jgi:hypothetical protein
MNPMSPTTLPLDADSIDIEELSLPALVRELNLQQRPNWVLRRIMNVLEAKRQAKGLGWSRAWNKSGLNVFRTHVQRIAGDPAYFAPVVPVLERLLPGAGSGYQSFARGLLADPALMAFTFYHNHDGGGAQHEGLTLSFGRRIEGEASRRDRLDLILEDRRQCGRVDGRIDRIRFFICPWTEYQNRKDHYSLEMTEIDPTTLGLAQELYQSCVAHYHAWKCDEGRQWSHWSARYIEYFGPRAFIPVGTSFS